MNSIISFFLIILLTYTPATTADVTTDSPYPSTTINDLTTKTNFEDVYGTSTPILISDGDDTSPENMTDDIPNSTGISPTLDSRFGTETETTTTSDTEYSTHINLEKIKDEVLHILKPTKEIIDTLEGSTSKPAEPLGKEASTEKTVSKGEAVGILIASLIIAVALICVTKILYNRYKMKTYDVRRHSIELGQP